MVLGLVFVAGVVVGMLFYWLLVQFCCGQDAKDSGEQRRRLSPQRDQHEEMRVPTEHCDHHESWLRLKNGAAMYVQQYTPLDTEAAPADADTEGEEEEDAEGGKRQEKEQEKEDKLTVAGGPYGFVNASWPKAVVVCVHGFGDSGSWFQRRTAARFVKEGLAVASLDLYGHGLSDGLHCHVESFDELVDDVYMYIRWLRQTFFKDRHKRLKFFVYGESMGGAISFQLAHKYGHRACDGIILSAPMLKVSEEMKPPPAVVDCLMRVAHYLPTLPAVPSSDVVDSAFKVPKSRVMARGNPAVYTRKPRLLTAYNILNFTDRIADTLSEFDHPFLVLHGKDDTVTDPSVSEELYNSSPSADKQLKEYEGAWHALSCGESEEFIDQFFSDITEWIEARL